MVTAFAIFRFVVDGATLNLYFSSREVALEILHVRSSIPQAPLFKREELKRLYFVALIGQRQLLYLSPGFQRNEEKHASFHAVFSACNAGVAHTMTALVEVERSLHGFPAGTPDGLPVIDIKIPAAIVHWNVVVAIAGNAAELSIFVE